MPKKKSDQKPIEQYDHKGKKRANNPPVGLVTPETDPDVDSKGCPQKARYAYDPHLDPQLQWAGKAEHTSFEVPTVSLHVHERIDSRSVIEAVRGKNGQNYVQKSLFSASGENPPLREAIEFYKHRHNWSNRLIAGDSLLVMNSLLEKEGLAGQVQMIYIDPPYGIKYGSNFQPFVNKRDVKDGRDEDLTAEPEQIRAFRDTWELGIHSYLTYLRDRLLLARELLTESGSVFVQISDENVHHVRELMDEVFGVANFCAEIIFRKTGGQSSNIVACVNDFALLYAKDRAKLKFRGLFRDKSGADSRPSIYRWLESPDGRVRRRMTAEELDGTTGIELGWKIFAPDTLISEGATLGGTLEFEFGGKSYRPGANQHWKTTAGGMVELKRRNRLIAVSTSLYYVRYLSDFPVTPFDNVWTDTSAGGYSDDKVYVVQTNRKVIQRCLLMTTDPGDLVLDPTCGSGTTAYIAEQWGRRWITCDTSRVAVSLAKQRLMTALFDYYELAHPQEGVGSGFKYKTVPHVMLKSIANNEPPASETLYDQPFVDNQRIRVTGPFTVEAVPAPMVKPMAEFGSASARNDIDVVDTSIARSGETLRQAEWRAELLRTGIRGKNNQFILFSRVEPMGGTRWLQADAETKPNQRGANSVRESELPYGEPLRAVISFGPEHAPLEQRQVELAWEEARTLFPRPRLLIFAAFQFDPEAAKDIDGLDPVKAGMTFLKVQMNADLLTEDLKKKRASNESFWLIGQPDVILRRVIAREERPRQSARKSDITSPVARGDKPLYQVRVLGFDYYNTKTGVIESGGTDKIALWMLDPDYDGRSLFPRQVFFPMAGEKEGWSRLARNLKAEIDEDLIEAYRGTVSLPFVPGKRVAVKIVDDRGIESLKIVEVE